MNSTGHATIRQESGRIVGRIPGRIGASSSNQKGSDTPANPAYNLAKNWPDCPGRTLARG